MQFSHFYAVTQRSTASDIGANSSLSDHWLKGIGEGDDKCVGGVKGLGLQMCRALFGFHAPHIRFKSKPSCLKNHKAMCLFLSPVLFYICSVLCCSLCPGSVGSHSDKSPDLYVVFHFFNWAKLTQSMIFQNVLSLQYRSNTV